MAIITTPGAGVSPYETTTTTPAVLRAGADGSTTLAVVADTATGSNTSVYVSGQAALNSLITSSQPGVFEGANVTINLEEQLFNTTNQVTATTNYPSGNTGEIQYNSGANSFASDAYFTYTNSNVITPGIRTNNYLYANGAPFLAGGNAAIGNFVFTGDNMTIAHANSTLNINGNGTGNVNVTANGNTWTFGSTGILTLPGGPRIVPVGANIELQAAAGGYAEIVTSDGNNYVAVTGSDAQIVTSGINTWTFDNVGNLILPGNTFAVKYANGDTVAISTGGFPLANGTSNIDIATANGNVTVGVSGNTWTFDNTSALIFPSNAEITSDMTGAAVFQHEGGVTIAETNGNSLTYNSVLELFDNAIHIGTDQQGAAYSWNFSQDGSMTVPGNISGANVITANVFTASSNVSITSSGNTWTFNTDGNLILPGNIIAINYANGNRVTGNITFRDEIVIGTGTSNLISGLYLAPSSSSADANMYLRVRGNIVDEPTHIHFDTGNNAYYNQFIGDDNKYIQLANTGNIVINSNDLVGNAAQWNFGADGNLTLPGSLIVPANSIITGVGASPAPSINGFNNIDAIAFSASGNVTANNLSGTNLVINSISSDDSSFVTIEDGVNITTGSISSQENLSLTANAQTWTFRNDGVGIVLPGGAAIRDTSGGSLAIGVGAGALALGNTAVAIGYQSAFLAQGNNSVAIGRSAGETQGEQAVAIGLNAGRSQGNYAVAIGKFSANSSQGEYSVAIGPNAGFENQLSNAVSIGSSAGASSQGINSVAVGVSAAYNTQGNNAVAIGNSAAYLLQGLNSVAIGDSAGIFYLGNNSIAIGANAGNNLQGNNSIVFNATGSNLRNTTANTFTVAPIRNDVANIAEIVFYNTTSKEITYGNIVSVAGNVTGGNISTAGLVKTGSFVTGTIPAASGVGAGARAFVTDADSITFGNLYVGGAANAMPVWSNGTNWYIG